MLAAAQAIAQTVGIILLSTQLSPDNHIQALIPRIQHDAQVEDHTAFITFDSCDMIGSSGWTINRFTHVDGMLYVKLDRDRVKITTESAKPARRVDRGIADTDDAPRRQPIDLGLPHLRDTACCGGKAHLRDEYVPPLDLNAQLDNTSALAALVDFPGATDAQACRGTAGSSARIDTQIMLPPGDTVVISARGKTLRLKGSARVYIVDFPTSFLEGTADHVHRENHFLVYFEMLAGAKCNNDWRTCAGHAGGDCAAPFRRPGGHPLTVVPNDAFNNWAARVDILCSDSQYP